MPTESGVPTEVLVALITGLVGLAAVWSGRLWERQRIRAETVKFDVEAESITVASALSLVGALNAEVDSLRAEVRELRAELEKIKSELEGVRLVADEREGEVEKLRLRITEQRLIIDQQEKRIEHLEAALIRVGINPEDVGP